MSGQRYGVYSEFKTSGGGWLGDIPTHWSAKKLKFLARIFASNVDKKTKDGELPVQLCNYTDVYYNDVVSPDLPFMKATATKEQIDKFTLRSGDTIITKDSEDRNDIAVPAFVENDMPGVICGYHLSMIRPTAIMSAGFLNRTFQCAFARAYFATRSNGLTRYGLGGQALGSVVLPVPPLKEQNQIAKFLDYETAKIDALIEKQQQLIAVLKEKRQAVISHAVTKGLDPDALMRDSGVEWLGEVPAHWTTIALKHHALIIDCKHVTADFVDDGFPLASIGEVKGWHVDLATAKRTTDQFYKSLIGGGRRPRQGDIIYTRNATVGEAALVDAGMPKFAMGQDVCLIRPSAAADPQFLLHCLKSPVVGTQVDLAMIGSTFKRINVDDIRNFSMTLPPAAEQVAIVDHLSKKLPRYDALVGAAEATIALVQERRIALISAAVTGKIDVRDWARPTGQGAG